MKNLIFVMGVPGCGKSTIARYLSESSKGTSLFLDYGDLLLEFVGDISHKDELLKVLDSQAIYHYDGLVVKRILNKRRFYHLFLEFHTSAYTEQGFIPFRFEELRLLKPTAILLVEAQPRDISDWRIKDNTSAGRRRRIESHEFIRFHQEINRLIACVYSVITGAPLKIIFNEKGRLQQTLIEAKKWIENFSSP